MKVLGSRARDVLVRGAVRTIAAHFILLVVVVIDGVEVRIVGHGRMEGRVEHERHLLVGHNGAAGVDAEDGGRVMERRELGDLVHRLHDFVGDERRLGECLARGDDAVADGVDLVHRGEDARLAVHKFFEDEGDGFGMVRKFLFDDVLLPLCLVRELAARDADAFAGTLGDDALRLHVDELILERGAPRVDD